LDLDGKPHESKLENHGTTLLLKLGTLAACSGVANVGTRSIARFAQRDRVVALKI